VNPAEEVHGIYTDETKRCPITGCKIFAQVALDESARKLFMMVSANILIPHFPFFKLHILQTTRWTGAVKECQQFGATIITNTEHLYKANNRQLHRN